ncbi:MAG: hypothetical protein U0637_09015 [Phycisphaerales bacterium]
MITRSQLIGLTCVAAASALPVACVTVKQPHAQRGVPIRDNRVASARADAQSRAVSNAQLPAGPVAQPVTSGVSSARVQITVAPKGFVRYDAQTLPLVSPDGRFIAVQSGEAPTWDTLLATDRQEPADNARISVVSLEGGAARTVQVTEVPLGCTLGRDATAEGFLIESVRPDGARWIGIVAWASHSLKWLVQGGGVASHAAFVRTGSHPQDTALVYQLRSRDSAESSLVFRDASGAESILATGGTSYCYPTSSPDGTVIFAVALTEATGAPPASNPGGALDIVAARLVEDVQRPGGVKLGALVSQRPLGNFADVQAAAHQVFASMQPSAWCSPYSSAAGGVIAFTHPGKGRAAVMDPGSASFTWMPEKTISAAGWGGAGGSDAGYFCTAPRELVFQSANAPDNQAPARILPSPYVARVVVEAGVPRLLLFGPAKQREDELEVLQVTVGAPPPAAR